MLPCRRAVSILLLVGYYLTFFSLRFGLPEWAMSLSLYAISLLW